MADVFVSYGREDKERIKPIVDGLELLGVSAWHDERIKAGSQWDDEIETEIKQARAVIVCWSKASVVSRPVRAEALYARDHSKIVPCTLELCEIPLQLVYEQAEDLSGWTGAPAHAGWRKMLESIGKRIERPGPGGSPRRSCDGRGKTSAFLGATISRRPALSRGFGLYQKDRSAAFRERNELRTRGDRGRGHAVRRDERKDITKLLRRVRTMDRQSRDNFLR
ncbi:MAG: toll/interleukin-1 receptor domain-containing protein [Methylocystis sp.]